MDGEEDGSQSLPVFSLSDISLSQLLMSGLPSQEGSLSLNPFHLPTSQENSLRRYIEKVLYITSRLYSCDSENKYANAPLTQISQPESLSLHLPEPQVVSPAQETSITGNKVPLIRPTAKLLHPVQEVCLTIMFRVRFTKEERSSSI